MRWPLVLAGLIVFVVLYASLRECLGFELAIVAILASEKALWCERVSRPPASDPQPQPPVWPRG